MNIYQSLYDLLNTYVFGGQIVANTNQELIAILMATAGTVFLVSLPFLVVWRIIRFIGNI